MVARLGCEANGRVGFDGQALEGRASEAKETYASDLAAYKYTKDCQEYEEYLVSLSRPALVGRHPFWEAAAADGALFAVVWLGPSSATFG